MYIVVLPAWRGEAVRRIKQKKLMELIDVVRRGLDDVICHGGMPETMQTVIHE